MLTAELFGTLAATMSLVGLILGNPAQILKNYQTKTSGLSLVALVPGIISSALWGTYGLLKDDQFLMVTQFPSAVLTFILLAQTLHYKK